MSFYKLIQGNCLKVLPIIENKRIDLILTDPPYGVDENYGGYYIDSFENWKKLISGFLPMAQKMSKCVLISTSKIEGEHFLFINYPPTWRVCWYKGASVTRSPIGFKDWETIFVYGKPKKQVHDFFMVHANRVRKEISGHPCPKPEEWARWLITRFSERGDVVLDPFIGSGTIMKAAQDLGRSCIGIEINPEYCEIVKKRCFGRQFLDRETSYDFQIHQPNNVLLDQQNTVDNIVIRSY